MIHVRPSYRVAYCTITEDMHKKSISQCVTDWLYRIIFPKVKSCAVKNSRTLVACCGNDLNPHSWQHQYLYNHNSHHLLQQQMTPNYKWLEYRPGIINDKYQWLSNINDWHCPVNVTVFTWKVKLKSEGETEGGRWNLRWKVKLKSRETPAMQQYDQSLGGTQSVMPIRISLE